MLLPHVARAGYSRRIFAEDGWPRGLVGEPNLGTIGDGR